MIVTVEEMKSVGLTGSDDELKRKAKAIEELVRAYTHNNFQNRGIRSYAQVSGNNLIFPDPVLFKTGDTVQISQSAYSDGVYEITSQEALTCVLSEVLPDEDKVLVTLIKYPEMVRNGALELLKWEKDSADKRGIQSETISRHSVTYFNMDGDNSLMGYPRSMMGFLTPYMKARF